MFIIDPITKEDAGTELKVVLLQIERKMGFIPPHFALFASIDLEGMEAFLLENMFFMTHERIDADLMPYLRLEIAKKECRNYCIAFNEKLLDRMQHPQLDEKQTALQSAILKAIYDGKAFNADDIAVLEAIGFEHIDFFRLLRYCTNFIGLSRMIETYLK